MTTELNVDEATLAEKMLGARPSTCDLGAEDDGGSTAKRQRTSLIADTEATPDGVDPTPDEAYPTPPDAGYPTLYTYPGGIVAYSGEPSLCLGYGPNLGAWDHDYDLYIPYHTAATGEKSEQAELEAFRDFDAFLADMGPETRLDCELELETRWGLETKLDVDEATLAEKLTDPRLLACDLGAEDDDGSTDDDTHAKRQRTSLIADTEATTDGVGPTPEEACPTLPDAGDGVEGPLPWGHHDYDPSVAFTKDMELEAGCDREVDQLYQLCRLYQFDEDTLRDLETGSAEAEWYDQQAAPRTAHDDNGRGNGFGDAYSSDVTGDGPASGVRERHAPQQPRHRRETSKLADGCVD